MTIKRGQIATEGRAMSNKELLDHALEVLSDECAGDDEKLAAAKVILESDDADAGQKKDALRILSNTDTAKRIKALEKRRLIDRRPGPRRKPPKAL